jgi:hypothetical protein
MRKITLLLTLLLVFGYSGYAQVSAYSFAQSAGNYTPITGGTVYLTGTFDDGISQGVTIPSFNYNGVAYTTLKINANGHIAFGTYTSTTNYSPLSSSTNANGGIVAALGRDLNSAESGTPEIRYELIGNEFVIQYKDVRRYGVSAEVLNFQIRLNTTNNVVSIVYGGTITPGLNTSYPEIGLKGATNNFLTNINNRTIGAAGGSWLNSLPGTSNASTMYFNSANVTTVPAVGTTFTFTPPVPCSGTPVAGSVAPAVQNICTGSTPTQLVGTGYSSGVSGITFQWEESNDDGATDTWAIAVGGTGATTANYTPPVFASTIYYRLVVTCTNSTTSAQTTSVLVSTPSAPVTQASAVIAPIATINYAQAIVNWTNGSGARRVVYISDSATFADPVNNNAAALTSNTVFTGSGQQIIFDGTGASVTVTGLATDTQYYIKVYEYLRCGSGPYDYYYNVTTGTNIGTFTTCGVLTVPTLEDFTTYLPGCWQEADNGDLTAGPATFGTGAWVADGFGNVTAVGAIKINIDATGDNDWILSPLYTVPVTGYELKFDAAATQYNSTNTPTTAWEADDFVQVLVSTGTSSWTVLYTFNNTNVPSNTGTPTIIDLDAYSGQNVRFAFRAVEGATDGGADIDFSVDNFEIRLTPACVEPTTLVATNITATSVDLSWVDPSATQFDFEYAIQPQGTGVPTGAGIAIGATSVVGATSDLDGVAFTANTPYEVYVRADCGGGDYSTWLGPINFRTLCSALSAPTTVETFNTFLPSCWTKTLGALTASSTLTGNSTAWVAVAGFGNTGANTASKINAYGGTVATPDNDWLISPAIDLGATAGLYRLKYKMAVTGYNGTSVQATLGTHQLRVVVSTDGGATWSDTNVIKTYTGAETYSNTGLDETILLTGYTGIVKIGFLVTTSSTSPDLDIHIDDFIVEAIPSCLEPSTLATANITATSVDLSWIDPSGTQFDFEYVIQAQGTGVPAGAGIAIGATLVTDSSLASNTAYEVYVRADCGGGSFSSWVGPVNFSTSINVLCGTPVNTTHCYSDNDATTWVFTSNDGSPLRITFNAGDMESCCDDILIYDGINNTGTLLYQGNNGGDLTGLVFDSTTDSIYVEIDSDGSVSCDNSGYVSIDFDVVCATCVSPTATFAVVADCANAQYFIDVDIITIGSANSLAISDGVTTLSADLSSGTQTFGPYANGASTTITVTNEQDASCSISSSVAYSCPPDNDECNDAIVLNVNADYLCGVTTSGTNVAATDSGVEPTLSVSGTSDNDVWFSFVAVQTAHRISLADKVAVVGTSVDMGIGVFSGTCSSLALVGSSDPDVYNVSGLTIGDTYLVNVYGWYSAGSNEAQVTFNICVGTDPTLSSSSFDSNAFLAYPNPVKDILNLEYNSEIASVRVLNLLGQEVISKTIKANATQVDMTPLSAGAYIVNVTVGDTVKTIKVVKQ